MKRDHQEIASACVHVTCPLEIWWSFDLLINGEGREANANELSELGIRSSLLSVETKHTDHLNLVVLRLNLKMK